MIIRKLNIYGFGKHENLSIEFTDGINVLYGLNEAGKTTIQQFILHILFGFPAKNQQLLRYEPKSGTKYGGQVHLKTENDGIVIVERVKGKASGDVTVHFENGKHGGEDDLRMILHHYDRHSFESIFSFSLLQLQGFEKMDEMELSRTLLASGTTGVDSLTQLEKRMQKEMETLFKPSGKKPEINKAIEELRDLELVLKDARKQMDQYAPTIQRISEIDEESKVLTEEETLLREEQVRLALYKQAAPLVEQKKTIQLQLERYEGITFPAEGIRRMDSLENRILDEKTAIDQLRKEMNIDDVDRTAIYEDIESLQLLLERESEWHQWRSIENELSSVVKKMKLDVNRLRSELGLSDLKKLLTADLSLMQEEKLLTLVSEYRVVDERIRYYQQQKEEMDSECKELDYIVQNLSDSSSTEEMERAAQWPGIQRKLSEAKAYVALAKGPKNNNSTKLFMPLIALTVLGALFGVMTSNWPVLLLSVILLATSVILFVSTNKKDKHSQLKEMQSIINRYAGKEEEYDLLYHEWERLTLELERTKAESARVRRKMESIAMEMIEANRKMTSTLQTIEAFAARYGLEPIPSIALLPEIFKMMRELQSIHDELTESEQELSKVRGKIERRYEEALAALHSEFLPEEELYGAIRRKYSEQLQLKSVVERKLAELSERKERLREREHIYSALMAEQRQLMQEARAETVEQFYETFQKHKEKEDLQREKMQLEAQLEAIGAVDFQVGALEEVVEKFETNEGRLSFIRQRKEDLQKEKVRLEHVTEVLLNDDSYGLKLQEFEMKKAELAEMAKRWSVYKSVSEGIRQMLRNLKENKLPAVLNRAQLYFSLLSADKYTSLIVNEQGMFEAVSSDGMRYSIAELSQATKEQAYISLRFALAESLRNSAPFPIIMDDPFVHFDRTRLGQMVKLMSEMQQHHQFLYFTCHDEMTTVWEDATIILVNRKKGAISI